MNFKYFSLFILLCLFSTTNNWCQDIAVLKYKGGGDWYSNPTALPNLIDFCNKTIETKINKTPQTVETGSTDIFQFPYVYMTGHGNVFFNDNDVKNIRKYLLSGGFLHIDDNYGMQPYVIKELKKIFPNKELTELPITHEIFSSYFSFPKGLPKIHEHDGKRPQAFGIFSDDRLIVLFTYECDLGDGWEDQEIHNDPDDVRLKSFQMGTNIIKYAFEN